MTLTELNELRLNMIKAKRDFNEAAQKYAIDNCGHKFGDVVEVNWYSHRGKMIRFSSIACTFEDFRGEYFAEMSGKVLKADGTCGLNFGKRLVSLGKI